MTHELDASKKYTGTCQACFGVQSTKNNAGALAMVHHGYRRPGVGYIIGDCAGVDHLPYELSCEQTKVWAGRVREFIATATARKADLESGKIQSLTIVAELKKFQDPQADGWNWTIAFDVQPGHVPSRERGEHDYMDWAYYLRNEIRDLSGKIESATSDHLAMLEQRIREWVYAPEKLTAYDGAKKAPVVHLANVRFTGRPACSPRARGYSSVTTDAEKVTCTRCRTRL